MTERVRHLIKYGIIGALLGGLVSCAAPEESMDHDDDNPPIIVKGGSVIFEAQLAKGQARSPEWVADGSGNNWKQAPPNGTVTKFVVSVVGAVSGECAGTSANIILGHSGGNPPLHVNVGGNATLVGPKNQLVVDNTPARKTLKFDGGHLTSVEVGGRTCQLNNQSQVWIWPDHH